MTPAPSLTFEIEGAPALDTVSGRFRLLFLFDVADAIDLVAVNTILDASNPRQGRMAALAPSCIHLERAPVVEHLAPVGTEEGRLWDVHAKYYECGVVSLELESPFELTWSGLPTLSARWISNAGLDRLAAELMRRCLNRVQRALRQPYADALREDYAIIQLESECLRNGNSLLARELIEGHGARIAQMIRGECTELSEEEAKRLRISCNHACPTTQPIWSWRGGRRRLSATHPRAPHRRRNPGARQHSVVGAQALR